jgi:general secretion pathway protein G
MKTDSCNISGRRGGGAGFTLFEIMLVLGIIVLLMGLGINAMRGTNEYARETAAEADIQAFTIALRTYETYNQILPTTEQGLRALVDKPVTAPVPRRWKQLMETLKKDPWNEDYVYLYPGRRNPGGFDLFSPGPDRKPNTDDDIGNWPRGE